MKKTWWQRHICDEVPSELADAEYSDQGRDAHPLYIFILLIAMVVGAWVIAILA